MQIKLHGMYGIESMLLEINGNLFSSPSSSSFKTHFVLNLICVTF